jgi:light-regulated signal transduction histidine kinase (bacteriophytochrome)
MFKLFADLIGFHLDAQERLTRMESALLNERQHAELRDQFIGVLGHDLRNPARENGWNRRSSGPALVP